MNVLISNDDGIESKGVIELAKEFSKDNSVLLIAPEGNRSASAHSLTIEKSLFLKEIKMTPDFRCYSLSGTPVDCVKFAKLHFVEFEPDLVISGINLGHNIGSDILYSGTVSIACEAAFFGHVAFAFSCCSKVDDLNIYASMAVKIVNFLMPLSKSGDIWNINFPKGDKFKGVKFTKLGKQLYTDRYENIGSNEFRLVGELINHDDNDSDCDVEWLKKGYVTITPILFNKTDYTKIEEVKEICVKL